MKTHRYCITCYHPLSEPTAYQDLVVGFACPVCQTIQPKIKSNDEWLGELSCRFQELEKKLEEVEQELMRMKCDD